MAARYDERGKLVSDIVTKQSEPVIVHTLSNRIRGNVHLRPGIRMKDQMNNAELFLALTEATIYSVSGQPLYQTDFLLVNREQIVWILPESEIIKPAKPGA